MDCVATPKSACCRRRRRPRRRSCGATSRSPIVRGRARATRRRRAWDRNSRGRSRRSRNPRAIGAGRATPTDRSSSRGVAVEDFVGAAGEPGCVDRAPRYAVPVRCPERRKGSSMSDERLISADSHVAITQAQVKRHLDAEVPRRVRGGGRRVRAARCRSRLRADERGRARSCAPHPSAGRPGYARPARAPARHGRRRRRGRGALLRGRARSATSTSCKDGWREATRAFNDAHARLRRRSTPSASIVSYQIPIHDIDAAVRRGASASPRSACKSLQLPVFPPELGLPDYFHERYDPLLVAIQETGLPICCHIGLNTASTTSSQRDPTPRRGIMVPMAALLSRRGARHVDHDRRARALPRPQARVRRARPRLGRVVAVHRRRHGHAPGLRLPGAHRAAELLLPPQRVPHVHRGARRDRNSLRHRIGVENIMWSSDYPHPVSSWPNSRDRRGAVRAACPTTSAS